LVVVATCTADVGVNAWEPDLLEGSEACSGVWSFPDCGSEGGAVVIKTQSLEGVDDAGGNFGVDEGILQEFGLGKVVETKDGRDAERTNCIPNANSFDGDVWTVIASLLGLLVTDEP
jgi:hypothetical protein